jgi:2-polyprenyl-3-methyl-5-hydroxy-6-metoxy-1,4-benzoquinol methylase
MNKSDMMAGNVDLEAVHQRESAFFDDVSERFLKLTAEDQKKELWVDEAHVLGAYPDHYQYAYNFLGNVKGKKILDIGCGSGKSSVILAKKGAFVTAFDVSPKAVEVVNLRARINNVADKVEVKCLTVEGMPYPAETFDFVFGVAILHHLNVEIASRKISRVLKKGGQAVFIEPIAFSGLFKLIRNLSCVKAAVPNKGKEFMITDDERQIYREDLECFRACFKSVDFNAFQLFSRLDRLIGGYPVTRNKKIVALINRFDRFLLRSLPHLKKYGRWGVIRIIK